jgi:hypothetical protein
MINFRVSQIGIEKSVLYSSLPQSGGACRLVLDITSFAGMDKELEQAIMNEVKSHFFQGGIE